MPAHPLLRTLIRIRRGSVGDVISARSRSTAEGVKVMGAFWARNRFGRLGAASFESVAADERGSDAGGDTFIPGRSNRPLGSGAVVTSGGGCWACLISLEEEVLVLVLALAEAAEDAERLGAGAAEIEEEEAQRRRGADGPAGEKG